MPPESITAIDPTQDTLKVCSTRELEKENDRRAALLFCYSACRLDGHCLGWMPKQAYDVRHDQGRILVLHNNDDLVGLCMWSTNLREMRCLQIWIRQDARMILHGKKLIHELEKLARQHGCCRLRLWCAIDLPANLFWHALGFRYHGWRWGRAKNSRRHALWIRRINPTAWELEPSPLQDALQSPPPLALPTRMAPHSHQATTTGTALRSPRATAKTSTAHRPTDRTPPPAPRTTELVHVVAMPQTPTIQKPTNSPSVTAAPTATTSQA